jgi:hypothetical protein
VSVVSRAFADDVLSRFQWFAARAAVGAFKFEVSAELTCVSMSGAALYVFSLSGSRSCCDFAELAC